MAPAWVPGLLFAILGGLFSIALGWMNNRHQRRLETDRASAAKDLEVARAEIGTKGKAAEKRATVAADALLTCLELLDAMQAAASVARLIDDPEDVPGEDTRESTRRRVAVRRQWVEKYDDQFDRVYKAAQVYLPDAVCDALERLRKLKFSMHVNRAMHAETIGMDHRPDQEKFFSGGYGAVPNKQIDDLRDELKRLLRPLAQLAQA